MSKQLFSFEFTSSNSATNLSTIRNINKSQYRERVAFIQEQGGPLFTLGKDPENLPVELTQSTIQAMQSTSLIFCYTDKFNQPLQNAWASSICNKILSSYGVLGAGAGAGADLSDKIEKWTYATLSPSKMNYERVKNVFVLEGLKDFGGNRGDVDLLGSIEDHASLVSNIKELFPNGSNLASISPDEVCDEWLTAPPTVPPRRSNSFYSTLREKEANKDEQILRAARETGAMSPEMYRIFNFLYDEGMRNFLFDAGVEKIPATQQIITQSGASINPKTNFYYTKSFDAAPEIAGYGVGIFKQSPLAPAAPAPNDHEALEREINMWVNTNIIAPLQQVGPAVPATPAIEGYFIQPGLDCDNGFLFEISVYTKKTSDNLQKVSQPIIEQLLKAEANAKEEEKEALEKVEKSNNNLEEIIKVKGEQIENLQKAKKNENQNALKAASQKLNEIYIQEKNILDNLADDEEWYDNKNEERKKITNIKEETIASFDELLKICSELKNKLSILRYLVFLPKDRTQEAIISVSIPTNDYKLSITQARYNYKSTQHPNEAIRILPFNDCKFYQKIEDNKYLSLSDKAAFCVLQKWNCDQNDAILNALVPNSCLLSVDKPAIAATIARGGNAFLFGDKSKIYNNKKFYRSPPAQAIAEGEEKSYVLYPAVQLEEAHQAPVKKTEEEAKRLAKVRAEERKQQAQLETTRQVEPAQQARALRAVARGAGAGAGAGMDERERRPRVSIRRISRKRTKK